MERSTKGFLILTLLLSALLVSTEGGRDTPKEHGEEVYTPQGLLGLGGLGPLGWGLGLGLGLGLPFGLGGLPFLGLPGFGLLPWLKDGKSNTKEEGGGNVPKPKPKGDGKVGGGYYP